MSFEVYLTLSSVRLASPLSSMLQAHLIFASVRWPQLRVLTVQRQLSQLDAGCLVFENNVVDFSIEVLDMASTLAALNLWIGLNSEFDEFDFNAKIELLSYGSWLQH